MDILHSRNVYGQWMTSSALSRAPPRTRSGRNAGFRDRTCKVAIASRPALLDALHLLLRKLHSLLNNSQQCRRARNQVAVLTGGKPFPIQILDEIAHIPKDRKRRKPQLHGRRDFRDSSFQRVVSIHRFLSRTSDSAPFRSSSSSEERCYCSHRDKSIPTATNHLKYHF